MPAATGARYEEWRRTHSSVKMLNSGFRGPDVSRLKYMNKGWGRRVKVSDALAGVSRLYLDSAPVIDFVEQNLWLHTGMARNSDPAPVFLREEKGAARPGGGGAAGCGWTRSRRSAAVNGNDRSGSGSRGTAAAFPATCRSPNVAA